MRPTPSRPAPPAAAASRTAASVCSSSSVGVNSTASLSSSNVIRWPADVVGLAAGDHLLPVAVVDEDAARR